MLSAKTLLRVVILLWGTSLIAACGSHAIQRKDGSLSAKPWSVTGFAKSDIDDVVEIHQREVITSLKLLTEKLYKRNPAELRKGSNPERPAAIETVFAAVNHWHLSSQRNLDWAANINQAFREDFSGDRVHALMSGVLAMVLSSYDHKTDVYLLDSLDPQKLYNAARNIEIVAWRLANTKNATGELLFLTNDIGQDGPQNLSFEREFGKLIATQDLIARVIEDKTNRSIRSGVVNVASMILLPI